MSSKRESKDDGIRVDLSLKDTEYGWMRRWDAFFISAAPAWFNVLGWIALLAGVQFVNAKRHHWLLQIVIALSLLLLWQYFIAAFCSIELVLPARFRRVQIAFFDYRRVYLGVHMLSHCTVCCISYF